MSAANLHIEWAALLVDGLARAGIREAVVSPGSRSTPIVLAAARHGAIRVHSIVDERSAAFFALGAAKVTGRPVLLVCTSGTAGAHYYPAVIEAAYSHTPLIVLTADRPPELHGNAAPQTIDQNRLFGPHARAYFEIGLPDERDAALRALRRKAAQAVLASVHPTPGAVHINAWFRKPLEPQAPNAADEALRARLEVLRAEPFPVPYPPVVVPDADGIDFLADLCRRYRRGLLVCGPAPLSNARARQAIEELAETLRYPILAEGTSQVRFTGRAHPLRADGFDAFLRSDRFRERHTPQVVIQIGQPPTSKAWERFASEIASAPRVVIAPHGWNDPQGTAAALLLGPIEETVSLLKEAMMDMGHLRPSSWTEDFAAADGAVWKTFDDARRPDAPLEKSAVARAILSSLPEGSLLAIGNSLPVREIDSFCPGWLADVPVWSQKGANGIDGLVSGAAGAAMAHGGPATAYIGDLAFLHDLHGLAAARRIETPFVVVVAQNDGGRIFEQIPIAEAPGVENGMLALWTTPHGLDLAHAALLFNLGYRRVESESALREALLEAHGTNGCTIIEAVVPPSGALAEHRRFVEAVAERLPAEGKAEP